MDKPRVLILIGALWPGHDSSGPALSVRAMCEAMRDAIEFRLIARDRPFGAQAPIVDNTKWLDQGFAKVRYLPLNGIARSSGLINAINTAPHDILMLNSFFDSELTVPALLARRLGRVGSRATILSPRGEFSKGALGLKAVRKHGHRMVAKRAGLLREVIFHTTSDAETDDVRAHFPDNSVVQIGNMRPLFPLPPYSERKTGEPLRIAFLGRISPVKGLDLALRALAHCRSPIIFNIFGPVYDQSHWADCEALIKTMPQHVTVRARGEIENADAAKALAQNDLFLLPSRSENFGHAIFEALASGTPVIIGDQTPWRGLEAVRAGYDLRLDNEAGIAEIIDRFAVMPTSTLMVWRKGARDHAERFVATSGAEAQWRKLFKDLVGRG